MHADPADPPSPAPCRRKPTRAETARANGALSRGPVTPDGKRRSSRNALAHGLRARRHVDVAVLGEDAEEAAAHFAAVRAELGAVGPVARDLAETAASAMLRAARGGRLEGELLAGLAEGGRSVAAALHADRDARATLALLQRYRRDADGDLRRSLDALLRLHRARADGLLPDGEEAGEAQAGLDEVVADLPAPSEPRIEKIVPVQAPGERRGDRAGAAVMARRYARPPAPARAVAAATRVVPQAPLPPPPSPPEPPPVFTGAQLLRQYRWFRSGGERARMWGLLSPVQRADMLEAATAGRPGGGVAAADRDPAAPYASLAPLLAGP